MRVDALTSMSDGTDITGLLTRLSGGDDRVIDQLTPLVYDALYALARRQLRGERPGHTLSPTALVNEAYLKLAQQRTDWKNRAQFMAIAARIMRRILINHATKRRAVKRGAGMAQVTFDDQLMAGAVRDQQLLDLHEALERLAQLSERQARVVEMRFFGGMTHEEVAEVLGVSAATARLDWRLARAWLTRELAT